MPARGQHGHSRYGQRGHSCYGQHEYSCYGHSSYGQHGHSSCTAAGAHLQLDLAACPKLSMLLPFKGGAYRRLGTAQYRLQLEGLHAWQGQAGPPLRIPHLVTQPQPLVLQKPQPCRPKATATLAGLDLSAHVRNPAIYSTHHVIRRQPPVDAALVRPNRADCQLPQQPLWFVDLYCHRGPHLRALHGPSCAARLHA